ncbi:MAG: helix-turn-helix domain-containing protein [Halobacteriales archaeon]|nr:helix-turn-helix domain-containing protein [Halobacteriales archaeon]
MVISTKIYIEHPDIALSHTIQSLADVDIGVVSDVGTNPGQNTFFFWFETSDFGAVETTLAEDHTVADFSLVVEMEDQRTYQIEYSEDAKLITPAVVDVGGLTLESENHSNGWIIHLQLPDHDALLDLKAYADEEDIRLDVLELHQSEGSYEDDDYGLTEPQREALVAAYVHGYYEEPRQASLADLQTILDRSQMAVSGRLRRGSARLIEAVLIDESE